MTITGTSSVLFFNIQNMYAIKLLNSSITALTHVLVVQFDMGSLSYQTLASLGFIPYCCRIFIILCFDLSVSVKLSIHLSSFDPGSSLICI